MKVYYVTFGCYCSRKEFSRFLKLTNYDETLKIEEADIVIMNLCALSSDSFRAIALGMIVFEQLKEINSKTTGKNLKLFVGGCAEGLIDIRKHYLFVDGIFRRNKLVEDLAKYFNYDPQVDCGPIHYKNCVFIQRGCSRKEKCGFCIKSYVINMPSCSSPVKNIVADIEATVADGYHDIVLFAENSTEYYDPETDSRLLDLLKRIDKIEGVNFLDLTGLCMDELSDNPDLVNYIANSRKIRKVQIEIQSLIPTVRQYMRLSTTPGFVYKVLRALINKYVCTNIMVGYPWENDEGFEYQLDKLEMKNIYFAQANIYDDTPGVYAHTLPQIPKEIAIQRLMILENKIREIRSNFLSEIIKNSDENGGIKCVYVGHDRVETLNYTAVVNIENKPSDLIQGQEIQVKITGVKEFICQTDPDKVMVLTGLYVQ